MRYLYALNIPGHYTSGREEHTRALTVGSAYHLHYKEPGVLLEMAGQCLGREMSKMT